MADKHPTELELLSFVEEDFGTRACDLVINAALVIHFGVDALVTLPDESSIEHTFK